MAQAITRSESAGGALDSLKSWPARLKEYFEDLQGEMRRVTWPTWTQVRATTLVVLATVFVFAAYFFVVDFALGRTITRAYNFFSGK
jgi:preprotein translocase subunit SecE